MILTNAFRWIPTRRHMRSLLPRSTTAGRRIADRFSMSVDTPDGFSPAPYRVETA